MTCSHSRVRHSLPLVVSLLALVVALGGTSYAAAKIHGNLLKNGTVANKALKSKTIKGNKVRRDTLTGAQVRESALGQVPSAGRADAVADGAVGANALGTITGRSAQGTIPANSSGTVHPVCLAGERAIGGGHNGFNDLYIRASFVSQNNGWYVSASNGSNVSRTIVVTAYCLAP